MTIFGGSPDNPVSGQTPADALGNDSPIELSDQGDTLPDDDKVMNPDLGDQGSRAVRAERDPSGLATTGLQDDPLG